MVKAKPKPVVAPKPRIRKYPLRDCVRYLTRDTDAKPEREVAPIEPVKKIVRKLSPSQRLTCVKLV
jgi:hypothetical protein